MYMYYMIVAMIDDTCNLDKSLINEYKCTKDVLNSPKLYI